jgi:hypothetical protein
MDAGEVDILCHLAAKCVDFTHEMPFGKPSDGWIAAHLADGIEIAGEYERRKAHSGRGKCCFRAGVTGADYYNIKFPYHCENSVCVDLL